MASGEEFSVKNVSIGFIGAGQMALAIAKGWLKCGVLEPEQIIASSTNSKGKNAKMFKELGCVTTNDNLEVLQGAEVVVIAVKPHIVPGVINQLSAFISQQPPEFKRIFISVAAGVPLEKFRELRGSNSDIVRIMTNVACAELQAMTVSCLLQPARNRNVAALLARLFEPLGSHLTLPEAQMNAIVGTAGSGPAFMFTILEGMSDGGVRLGLPRDVSNLVAIQTMLGAATLAKAEMGKRHLAELRESVCSPGGTTMAGLMSLERNAIRANMMEAVEAACKRSEELGLAALRK